ncbi:MAG: acylglycerol kinase family protein [Parashewanella sp.]
MAISNDYIQLVNPAHTLLVVNPSANGWQCAKKFQWLSSELNLSSRRTYTIIKTTKEWPNAGTVATAWFKANCQRYYFSQSNPLRVFAVGGDGTFSETIEAFHNNQSVQVGVLPLGTLNDAAHRLNINPKTANDFDTIITSLFGATLGCFTVTQCDKYGTPTSQTANAWIDVFAGIMYDTLEAKRAADKSPDCLSYLPNDAEMSVRRLSAAWSYQGLPIEIKELDGEIRYSGNMANLSMTTVGRIGKFHISPHIQPQWRRGVVQNAEIHIAEHSGWLANNYHLLRLMGTSHKESYYDWSQAIPLQDGESATIYCKCNTPENAMLEIENGQRFEYPIKVTYHSNQVTLVAGKPPK